ncbi:MAG: PorT family protein [Hymenobacteraceae bacterium]|nr:PorT family protein [Hymenobacteraceae bacterium]MDX5395463.1 PorT family protein [Hymenobacteraceae bacterium]MDX5511512.1 PorT family protein [Hymenobacteraceae bacterium]
MIMAAATTMPVFAGENVKKLFTAPSDITLPTEPIPAAFKMRGFFNGTTQRDTIIVKMANDAKMVLYLKDTKQLKTFRSYSLDSLMILLDNYVTKVEQMDKDGNKEDITVQFRPADETNNKNAPEQINITVRTSQNTATGGKTETTVVKPFKIQVDYKENGETETVKVTTVTAKDSVDCKPGKKKNDRYDWSFDIDLGWNAVIDHSDSEPEAFELRPWGSRYVSLNPHLTTRIGGEKSVFYLQSGLQFAFNNYMFEGNTRLYNDNGFTRFYQDSTLNLEKTKLATSSINLPLMALLKFKDKNGKESFKFGVGGFAGYRLGAHTKIKYTLENDTKKDKGRGSFNLEDFQYGVNALVGYRGLELFAKYNINTLFKDNRGPDVSTISFGVRL